MSEEERAGSQVVTQVAGGATDSDREAVAREIGAQLKEGREAQRLSLEDVGARLKVAPNKLLAIESGDVSSLMDVTFAKGVMRAYARTLQIDIDRLLGQYHARAQATPVTGITRRHDGAINQTFDDRKRFGTKSGGAGGRWIWLVCMLALIGVGVYFGYDHAKAWFDAHSKAQAEAPATDKSAEKAADEGATQSNGDGTVTAALPPVMAGNDSPAPSEAAPAEQPAGKVAAAVTTSTPAPAPVATTSAGTPLATSGALNLTQNASAKPAAPAAAASTAPAVSAVAAATPVAAPAASGDGSVQLRFAADTWYEVRDRTGKVILGGTAKAGDAVAGSGAGGPYKVILGNVKGVESLAHNGAPVNFKSADRNNVARLTLQ